jgi:fluoride exporter
VTAPVSRPPAPRGAPDVAAAAATARLGVARVRAAAILAGGATGALVRAAVAEALPTGRGEWPWATFAVNVAGALFLAWLTTRLTEVVAPTRYWRFLLGTGLCGALTTFSTFQVETIRLAKDGYPGVAFGYAAASVLAGMAVAVGATVLARRRRYG